MSASSAQTTNASGGGASTQTHGTMGSFEVLAQSIAGIAPSAVMATGPALVAIGAGDAIMYSYLVSTIVLVMIGWCVSRFTERHGGGTLLSYITAAFGPGAGFVGAVGLVFGYVLIAAACVVGFAQYVSPLLAAMGIPGADSTAVAVVLMVICAGLGMVAMIRGVELSTRVGVVLEIISIVSILTIVVAVLGHQGLSSEPLHPSGLGVGSITGGMVLAILGYVGFESAACLGREARDPRKSVPRAVLGSVVIVCALYLISSYTQLVGFGHGAAIHKSAAPYNDLADQAGVHWLGYLVDVGASASFFACVTGSLNAAARLLAGMGRSGTASPVFARYHRDHETPHVAIIVLSVATLAIPVIMTLSGVALVDTFAETGTIGTFGYMLAYILLGAGTALYLRRVGAPSGAAAVIGGIASLIMVYVLFRSVYPIQPFPYDILPIIFLAVVLLALGWYGYLRSKAGGPLVMDLDADAPGGDVVDLRESTRAPAQA